MTTVFIPIVFLILLNSFSWSTSPPDYSRSTSPVMRMGITRLEAARPELKFGKHVIPKTSGYIEIVCSVEYESVTAALGDHNMTLKWSNQVETMIREERAFEKNNGPDIITTSTIAVTSMLPEDGGEFTCTLMLSGQDTGYKRSINVPDLDGSPIIKCDIDCERNQDEACQVLQYQIGNCFSYGFGKPEMRCRFNACDTEDSCSQNPLLRPINDESYMYRGYSTSGFYSVTNVERAADHVATVSGRFYCEARNYKGTTNSSVYLPVSAGSKKHPDTPSYGELQKASEQFFGRTTGVFLLGEKMVHSCFSATNDIKWTYFNISSNETIQHSSINYSYPVMYLKEDKSAIGTVSQIVIPEMNLYFGGNYECRETSGNNSALSFDVDTFTWAQDSNMNQNLHVKKLVGDTVKMSCTINTVKNQPSVYWKKGSQYVHRGDYDLSLDSQVLTIPRLTIKDSGVYTCSSDYQIGLERFEIKGMLNLTVVDSLVDEDVILFRSMISTLDNLRNNLVELAEKREG